MAENDADETKDEVVSSTKPAATPDSSPLIPPPDQLAESVGLNIAPSPQAKFIASDLKPSPPPLIAKIPQSAEPIASTPTSGNINTDIEKILREVKLPERRDFKGAAEPTNAAADAAQGIPTDPALQRAQQKEKDLRAIVMKPPTNSAEAQAFSASGLKPISSVHTLKDDLQNVVKEKKISLVRAVSLEQDKKRTQMAEEDFGRKERHKRLFGVLFATFLLFGLGFAALFGVYFVMLSHSATDVAQLNSLVFAEQSLGLPLDSATASELKRRIAAQRQGQIGSLGSITRIIPLMPGTGENPQPRQATTAEFFSALGLNAPPDLTRSLGDDFFFGLHVVDKNAPVLVLPVTKYDRAFASMLAWEKTMNADLAPAFTPVPSIILDANGIPSTRSFTDDILRNYDVRELKDDSGQIQLYYSFPSTSLLIIAESPYSFPELLSRLQSVRKL